MKTNTLDRNENGPPKGKSVETTVCNAAEVDLFVEGLEDVIASRLAANHNETMARDDEEITLEVEELEDVIAPRLAANHNETMVSDNQEIKLEVEGPEAPSLAAKHNHKRKKRMKEVDTSNRRNFLKVAGAGLVAASVPSVAAAALRGTRTVAGGATNSTPKPVYLRLWVEPRAAGGLRRGVPDL